MRNKITNHKSKFTNKFRYRLIGVVLMICMFVVPMSMYADYKTRSEAIWSSYKTLSEKTVTDVVEKSIVSVQLDMLQRQKDMASSLEALEKRIDVLSKTDPRKDGADDKFNTANRLLDTFLELDVTKKDPVTNEVLLVTEYEPYDAVEKFTDAEKDAFKAINDVNRSLLAPVKPGNVPDGDILEDFLPGVIRILMRFASLAVFISFIVSGVFLIVSFDNEERVTKAKSMLYYTLIGFAFVTLAFAIVKAVTDIDFFGFI